jgi:hypothetical protein
MLILLLILLAARWLGSSEARQSAGMAVSNPHLRCNPRANGNPAEFPQEAPKIGTCRREVRQAASKPHDRAGI